MNCRHCGSPLSIQMLDLGTSPPSNAYLSRTDLDAGEVYLPLRVMVCSTCWLAQTFDVAVRAEELFAPSYAYFSAVSSSWLKHSERYVEAVSTRFGLDASSSVVEIASNDGYLLQYFVQRGIPCLGIEPTASTAAAARERGVPTLEYFFGKQMAEKLLAERGPADLMLGNNVLAHVPDINDFLSGFATLLKPDGVVTFEFPSLESLIRDLQFDTVYHEHFSYLSLLALETIFPKLNLHIFDVERLTTHGGSLRVYAQRADTGTRARSDTVAEVMASERLLGLDTAAPFTDFQGKSERLKDDLLTFLLDAKKRGKTVAGYGAAAKGNTFLNFAGLRCDLIDFVVDGAAAKQGHFLPGSRIPIVAPSYLADHHPDYLILLPWNLRNELVDQLAFVRAWGCQFVVAVPKLEIF